MSSNSNAPNIKRSPHSERAASSQTQSHRLIFSFTDNQITSITGFDEFIVGRDGRDHSPDRIPVVQLEHPDLSRKHLKVCIKVNQVIVTDLGSTNGTFFEDSRLFKDVEMILPLNNCRLRLGKRVRLTIDPFIEQDITPDQSPTPHIHSVELNQELDELRARVVDLKSQHTLLEIDLDQKKSQIQVAEDTLADLKEEQLEADATIQPLQESIRHLKYEIQMLKEDARLKQILHEADEADLRKRKTLLEVAIGETELKRIEADRALLTVLNRQMDAEQETHLHKAKAQSEVAEVREEIVNLKLVLENTKTELQSTQKRLEAQSSESSLVQLKTEQARSIFNSLKEEIATAQTELSQLAMRFEQEESRAREHLNSELIRFEDAYRLRVESDLSSQKEQRLKKLEGEFTQVKIKETERVNQIIEAERVAHDSKRAQLIDEMVESTLRFFDASLTDHRKPLLKNMISDIWDGKAKPSKNRKLLAREAKFKKRFLFASTGALAVFVLLLTLFSLRTQVKESASQFIHSQNETGDLFLAEIKQRSLKYQPEQSESFQDSYTANMLTLKNYLDLKWDETHQTLWTLRVRDFLLSRGLSDQVVADFIASEMVLIKELYAIRKNILPQFKAQGIERMNTLESDVSVESSPKAKMLRILKTVDNYKRFRALEKLFYEEYLRAGLEKVKKVS